MHDFRISVVVPSFNQAQFVEATLQSLFAQQDRDLEILVVDGGSSDGSADVIRRHEDRLAWWVSERDDGQSHALNKGFARASGAWLCWLNSDDLLLPGALRALREHIAQAPDTRWWIGGGEFIDEQGRRQRGFAAPAGLSRPQQLSDWRSHWFAQPGTFFSRALFDEAGGRVREDMHYAMDLELWLRLLALAPPGRIDRALAAYRLHAQAKTTVLTPACEREIVSAVAEHLGWRAALDRVDVIAAERMEWEAKYRRLERWVAPALRVYSPLKRAVGRAAAPWKRSRP